MNRKLISIGDDLYIILGSQSVESTNELGTEYWKGQWGADAVLRNGDRFYFCSTVINAEFNDI